MALSVDQYANDLAQLRNEYRHNLDRSNKENRQTVDRMEKDYQQRAEESGKNARVHRDKLEKDYEVMLDGVKERTEKMLKNYANNFPQKREEEQAAHSQEMAAQRTEFQRRMQDLSDAYRTANKHQERQTEDVLKAAGQKYDDAVEHTKNKYEQEINRMDETERATTEAMLTKRAEEERSSEKASQNYIFDALKEKNRQRIQQLSDKERQVRMLQEMHVRDNEQLEKRNASALMKMRENNIDEVQKINDNFQEVAQQSMKREQANIHNLKRAQLEEKQEWDKLYLKEKGDMMRKIARYKDYEKNDPMGSNSLQQKLGDVSDDYEKSLIDVGRQFSDEGNRMHSDYLNELNQFKGRAQAHEEEKVQNINRTLAEVLEKSDRDRGAVMKNAKASEQQNKDYYESIISDLRRTYNQRQDRYVEQFSRQLEEMGQKNLKTLNDTKEEFATKNRDTLKSEQMISAKIIEELKKDFKEKFEKTVNVLREEGKLKEKERYKVEENYKSMLEKFRGQKAHEEQVKDAIIRDQQQELVVSLKEDRREAERQNEIKTNLMRRGYENKIEDMEKAHTKKLREITQRYEQQAVKESADNIIKYKRMENYLLRQQDKIIADYENRIHAMRLSVEERIKQLQDSYDNRMQKMQERYEGKVS